MVPAFTLQFLGAVSKPADTGLNADVFTGTVDWVEKAWIAKTLQVHYAQTSEDFTDWKYDIRILKEQWEKGSGLTRNGKSLKHSPKILHAARRNQPGTDINVTEEHRTYLRVLNRGARQWVKKLSHYGKIYAALKDVGFDVERFNRQYGITRTAVELNLNLCQSSAVLL
ncbi:hypothetical protein HDU93_002262 [Gonapodya sp. JEL0774]|nr:hypothetical protein HDU93_002262 [Gonapodya sp. JEL0774]